MIGAFGSSSNQKTVLNSKIGSYEENNQLNYRLVNPNWTFALRPTGISESILVVRPFRSTPKY